MFRRVAAVAVSVALAAVAATGCSSSSKSDPPPKTSSSSHSVAPSSEAPYRSVNDQYFLQAVHAQVVVGSGISDDKLIAYGHAVCEDWALGGTLGQIAADAANALPAWDNVSRGVLIGTATEAYCPQYAINP